MPGFRRILAILRAYLASEKPPADPPDGMLYSAESMRALDAVAEWFRQAVRDYARDRARRDGRTMVETDDVKVAASGLVAPDACVLPYLLGLDRELGEAISEYANAVGRHGPDSEEALAVRAKYAGEAAFADMADSLDRIKRNLGGSGIDYLPST